MNNKIVSLKDITKITNNEALSEKYVKYLCGINSESEYRHQEIEDINSLVSCLNLDDNDFEGFIYNYVVPQLNKEFDLLKVTDKECINIELKSAEVSQKKIKNQLLQNQYFLKMLGREKIWLFTYISSVKKLYIYKNDELVESSFNELENILKGQLFEEIDLDKIFTPNNILVSPLNSPDKFLLGKYLLTENQSNIKKKIIDYISKDNLDKFAGITGGPGTGKTLLIYDLAKQLENNYKILFIHCGILCEGHQYLNERFNNIKIISAKELRFREINNADIVIVDEAHRMYETLLSKIEKWVKKTNAICIFSYDINQKLSNSEKRMKTTDDISKLCGENIYKLTNRIRTNKEIALFITCLRDLSKYRKEYTFNNVNIMYEPSLQKALRLAKLLSSKYGYTYISYTSSFYNNRLDYQKTNVNTHTVIGQEFEKVCMIMDDNFYYDGHFLKGTTHPNPDYIFEQLLYQGLTRVRSKLAIIITDLNLLEKVLTLF